MAVKVKQTDFTKLVKTLPKGAVVETGAGLVAKPKKPRATAAPKTKKTDPAAPAKKKLSKDKSAMLRGIMERWAPELLPMIRAEYQFAKHLPKPRFWRADWVFLLDPALADMGAPPPADGLLGVAIEVDGGKWVRGGGRHNTDEDRDKMNKYARLGYLTLRYSPDMLEADPIGVVQDIRETLKRAGFTLPPPTPVPAA